MTRSDPTTIDEIRQAFAALREQRLMALDGTLAYFDREEEALWKRLQDAHDREYGRECLGVAVKRHQSAPSPPFLPSLVLRAVSAPIVAYRALRGALRGVRAWASSPSQPRVSYGPLGHTREEKS